MASSVFTLIKQAFRNLVSSTRFRCFEHAVSVFLLHRRYFARRYDASHQVLCTMM